jgi:hypothetical protein
MVISNAVIVHRGPTTATTNVMNGPFKAAKSHDEGFDGGA